MQISRHEIFEGETALLLKKLAILISFINKDLSAQNINMEEAML